LIALSASGSVEVSRSRLLALLARRAGEAEAMMTPARRAELSQTETSEGGGGAREESGDSEGGGGAREESGDGRRRTRRRTRRKGVRTISAGDSAGRVGGCSLLDGRVGGAR
jgi:hypothetical protein